MPMSASEVRQALRDLGDLRYAAGDLDDALRRIVQCTHDLFAVDGASLMLIDPDQLLRSVADSDERVGHLEQLQIEHGEGPCIDAFDDKELVHAADLAAERRWPAFSPAAVGRGLRAVLLGLLDGRDAVAGALEVGVGGAAGVVAGVGVADAVHELDADDVPREALERAGDFVAHVSHSP